MMDNEDLLNLVKTGSALTGTLALAVLNQRTEGAIQNVATDMVEQMHANGITNEHGAALGRNTPRSTSHGEAV